MDDILANVAKIIIIFCGFTPSIVRFRLKNICVDLQARFSSFTTNDQNIRISNFQIYDRI